jgi:hypothetical protein
MYFDLDSSRKLENSRRAIHKGGVNAKSPGPDGFNGDFLKKYWLTLA